MRTVWKFPVEIDRDILTVPMPMGARVLSVQTQRGVVCLWALVDPDAPLVRRYFAIVGTGHAVPRELTHENYFGSVQDGSFVWHFFEAQR